MVCRELKKLLYEDSYGIEFIWHYEKFDRHNLCLNHHCLSQKFGTLVNAAGCEVGISQFCGFNSRSR